MRNGAANESLHGVEIDAAAADGPALEELLAALELPFSSLTGADSGAYTARVYADGPDAVPALSERLQRELRCWSGFFRNRTPRLRRFRLPREDWAETWKRFFRTTPVSDRLVVKPSWECYQPRAGEIVLDMDPGMCFGTGYHGTTRACLQFMDRLQARLGSVSFLDAGCGSGILMLAAARLGFRPVLGFDNDPDAVATARSNLERAGLCPDTLVCTDLGAAAERLPRCRLVTANILAGVLCNYAATLTDRVDTSTGTGYLILSGILQDQYAPVKAAYEQLGCRELETCTIDEWQSGCFAVHRGACGRRGPDQGMAPP